MNYWGIQKRLLLITLLPCLITALALGGFFSIDRFYQQHEQFRKQAILLTQQVALQAHTLFKHSSEEQASELNHFMAIPNLRSVSLLTPMQQPIQHVGPNMLAQVSELLIENETQAFDTSDSIRLKAPVFSPNDILRTNLLGWVELEINTQQLSLTQLTSLFINAGLVIAFCLLAIYMAYRASARITRPLQHVTSTLNELESGNLNARIGLSEQTELNELATGINTMAASLQKAQQELQDNVEQATEDLKQTLEELEIQNIELSMARHSALEASKIKSDFLANMSHEIRTPLNGIIGFSKLLEKTRLNKRQLDYLNTIGSSSSSLLTIINDILDFSKIEAGKLVLDSVPVHLRELTDEVLNMLAPEAHKKGIELAALVYQDVPFEIMGDPIRLKQVLTNLINNAIKFTETGSVIIRIMIEEELEEKVALKVTVTDSGIGLTEKQVSRLFNAFSQADASTSRRFGGTGLGLVISQHLVKHMHGEIGVESESGSGSQFWFTGTFDKCDVYEELWEDAPWFNKSAYVFSLWEISNQVLLNQLSSLGYQVKHFSSLQTLLLAQNNQNADVIFLHIQDEMSNALIQDLRENSQIIALLNNNDERNWPLLKQLTIQHSLVFPISMRSLTQVSQDLFETPDRYLNTHHNRTIESSVHVLAVDDNTPNLELLSTWLLDLDVKVSRASGGLKAVQLASEQAFDIIFMDIQMPDLDGIQATSEIRQADLNHATPIVALTAHSLASERKMLLNNGFNDYLSKPLSEDLLIHTLSKWTTFKEERPLQNQIRMTTPISNAGVPKSDDNNVKNPILDWPSCLALSGEKPELAKTMTLGLIEEATSVLAILETTTDVALLLEPIHKLHGLCKYVGAQTLLNTLEKAETELKLQTENWDSVSILLIENIKSLLSFHHENPNWMDHNV